MKRPSIVIAGSLLVLLIGCKNPANSYQGEAKQQNERNNGSHRDSESRTAEARKEKVIPFTLTEHNNISIDVVLNKKHALALMFHTGNSDVCLTREATERLADLNFDQQGDADSWGGASSTRYCQGNVLQIGDQVWDDITVFEDRHSGQGTDGKFGPDLFQGKVIEIDFDRRVLVVHDSLPEIAATYQQFDCRQHRNNIFIKGQLQFDEVLGNRPTTVDWHKRKPRTTGGWLIGVGELNATVKQQARQHSLRRASVTSAPVRALAQVS